MDIFELRYPGTWLDNQSDDHHVMILLRELETHLADASVGLALFQQAQGRPRARPHERAAQRQARVQALQRVLESQIPATLVPQQRFEAIRDTHESADLQARREQWAAGQVPGDYENRLFFIYAHTVLFALENISKTLSVLTDRMPVPAGVGAARDGYAQALPDLVHVRDTAHHIEDRARGLDRNRNPLVLQPVNNGSINAPGGAVVLSSLCDDRLGYTASDGSLREVEISAQSVAAAQTAIQQSLDAFSWRGPSQTIPR